MEVGFEDPGVVVAAWLLSYAYGVAVEERRPGLRHLIPIVAVLIATFIYAFYAAVDAGDPVSWAVLVRGVVAGAVAVWGHSAAREIVKAVLEDDGEAFTDS